MKTTRFIISTVILLLLCIAVISGCTDIEAKTVGVSPTYIDGMKSGAKVDVKINEQGQKVTTYTNPDGSGGGSLELN